jgi:hypothetical protein
MLPIQGCTALGFGGAMIESYRRNSTKAVEGEYKGLTGKNWAVVVSADRAIQGEYPDIVVFLTSKLTERLVSQQDQIGAAGFIPADAVLKYQYNSPRWVAMPRGELAKALKVDRLIILELREYRLNEPGNQYLWAGLATGIVEVYESDSPAPDEPAFQKTIRVSFPDKDALGPGDIPRSAVATELGRRFMERSSWFFYKHQEPYYPKY